jgi:hypothetical protein
VHAHRATMQAMRSSALCWRACADLTCGTAAATARSSQDPLVPSCVELVPRQATFALSANGTSGTRPSPMFTSVS